MSCKIISASHASINGSSDVYGGSIVSASYNPSTINGYNRASVVIAGATSTPAGNDKAQVGIAGLSLNMRVGSVTETTRAGSVSTSTIHYYDNSQILDNTHVLLKEEVAEGLGGIGDKYGPRPDLKMLNDLGLIVPASDTAFVKLRDFYANYEAAGFNVDSIIASAPGKTIYTQAQFMEAFGRFLGDSFSFPAGAKVDFQGTLREVIGQMCDTFGMVAYWDPETDQVVTSPIGGGQSSGGSSNKCTIIGSSTTTDYTGSRSQGASVTFSTSNDGESQSSSGGNMSRYFVAKLLKPSLKMKATACGNEKIELNIFDKDGNTDPDIAKAISAAQNEQVYAMYALQSVLGEDGDKRLAFPLTMKIQGQDNQEQTITEDLGEMLPLTLKEGNNFLKKYYKCQLEDVYLVEAPEDKKIHLARTIDNQKKGWNENQGSSPYSVAGFFDGSKFTNGGFLFADKNVESSILGEGLNLTGDGDILRKLLEVIPKFVNSVYVVKSANAKRSAATSAKNYGYYITSNATAGGQSPKPEGGYEMIDMDPWVPLSECGNTLIRELATVCYAVHGTQNTCGPNPLSAFTTIDFIYALEHDKLEQLFGGNAAAAQQQTTAEALAQGGQGHLMYLMMPTAGVSPPDLGPTTTICFNNADIEEISTPSFVVAASQKIGRVSFGSDTILRDAVEAYDIGVISDSHNIHGAIPGTELTSEAPSRIPLWFNVEGNSSWIESGPGQAFLGAGSLPPGGAWKSQMKVGLSVNAADLAEGAGINQSYLADTYDEGFTYSRENLGIMADALKSKVANATWIDDEVGSSTSTTYLLVDDEMPDIPSVADGLDSLSITSAGGKTELTVTEGNASAIRARATLRDLKASSSHHQHSHTMMLPNVLNSAPNTKIQNIANGNPQ